MITKSLENKIGIEVELFLKNKKNELVIPSDYNIPTDDFIILAEVRAEPADNVADCMANFYKEYYKILNIANDNKLTIFNDTGWEIISPELYSKLVKQMGMKKITESPNIYKLDLNKLSDVIVDDGKITGHKVSTGLHIHFSSNLVITERDIKSPYIHIRNNLYTKGSDETTESKVTLASLLTSIVRNSMIRKLDKDLLPIYNWMPEKLKYRHAGFYEDKPWGFEYRSLSFNKITMEDLHDIIDYAFTLLNSVNKRIILK